MLDAILFLAGLRWGEMAALRWREYEAKFQGKLGRLVIARSFHHKTGTIKTTKTEVPQWVPVHPTLAKILAEWKLSGWAQLIGRAPMPDDFIMPDGPVLAHSSGVPVAKELQDEARAKVLKFKPGDSQMCRVPQNGLRASQKVRRVLAEKSELRELWEENKTDFPKWRDGLLDLCRRLDG